MKDFMFVENQIRKKTFGILTTVSPKGYPHATGIIFGVSPPNEPFRIYVVTGKDYFKVKNLKQNDNISFLIPFPHHFLRFVPASTVYFQGKAKILDFNYSIISKIFTKRIHKLIIEGYDDPEKTDDLVIVEICPNKHLNVHGLGYSLIEFKNNHKNALYRVEMPTF